MEVDDLRVEGSLAGALQSAAGANEIRPTLVLWLRPADLRAIEAARSVLERAEQVFMSGTLGGMEQAPVPAAWKPKVLMAYPLALPEARERTSQGYRAWFKSHDIAVADEFLQSDTYLACALLGSGVSELRDNLYRDYLVEQIEDVVERRPQLGLYPRIALGPGQRVASKSGYIVRFVGPDSVAVVPVGERIVP